MKSLVAHTEEGSISIDVKNYPDVCPVCNTGNEFAPCYAYLAIIPDVYSGGSIRRLEIVFKCPRQKCQRLFMANYSGKYLTFNTSGTFVYTEEEEFPESIQKISPKFCIIYNQSRTAEANKLDEIDGVGYGRALEFLIKDYLISLDATKAEEIKKQHKLGPLINMVNDPKAKLIVSRAAWLRNDETHYERKWVNEDIQTLKALIKLIVSHIENEELTKDILNRMPDPNSQKTEALQKEEESS